MEGFWKICFPVLFGVKFSGLNLLPVFFFMIKKQGTYLQRRQKHSLANANNAKERWIVEHQCEWQTFSSRMSNSPKSRMSNYFNSWNTISNHVTVRVSVFKMGHSGPNLSRWLILLLTLLSKCICIVYVSNSECRVWKLATFFHRFFIAFMISNVKWNGKSGLNERNLLKFIRISCSSTRLEEHEDPSYTDCYLPSLKEPQ